MTISRDEALQAMQQLERTEARTFDARVYRSFGGQLIVWGFIWSAGYALSGIWPQRLALIGPPLVVLGLVACFILSPRAGGATGRGLGTSGLRWTGQALAIVLFMYGTYVVFPITSLAQALTFPALMIAFMYALVGGARLTRMLWIGAALFALTLIGFVFLKPFIAFWLAAAGGGSLVVGGLWLRRA